MAEQESGKGYGYGKMPLWKWILIYVVIGIIVYGLIYYFVFAKKGGYTYNTNTINYPSAAQAQNTPSTSTSTSTTSATSATSTNIITTKTDSTKGSYLADFNGMTLYTYDKDTTGVSNCYNGCATAWPPYTSGATAQPTLPANITLIARTDGSKQFAWKGMPLYYYATDQKAGDITGDGVGGVWHIIKQ